MLKINEIMEKIQINKVNLYLVFHTAKYKLQEVVRFMCGVELQVSTIKEDKIG